MIQRASAWYALGAGGLAVMLTACTVNVNTEGATASETHSFKVTGAPTVTLDTFDGAIDVHSWDRPEVEVIVEKQAQDEARLKEIVVDQKQEGNTIAVTVRGPSHEGNSGISIGVVYSTRARLRVALPKATTLTLKSGDGAINVEDVAGTISLRTDDGSIVGNRVTGDVTASWKGSGGSSAVGTDYWYTDKELEQLTSFLGSTSTTMANQPKFYLLILNCTGSDNHSLSLLPSNNSTS